MTAAFLGLSLVFYGGSRARGPHFTADLSLTANADIPSRWTLGYLRACAKDRRERGKRRCSKTTRYLRDRRFVAAGPCCADAVRWPQTPAATRMSGRTGRGNCGEAATGRLTTRRSRSHRMRLRNSCFFGANQPLRHASRSDPAMTASGLCRFKAYAERPWERFGPRGRPSPASRKAREGSFCAKRLRTGAALSSEC